jgi:TonB family protein
MPMQDVMTLRGLGSALVLALAMSPAPAAAGPAWQSDWADETCSLVRVPDSDTSTVLFIRRSPGNERTLVSLLSRASVRPRAEDARGVTLSLDPAGAIPGEAYYSQDRSRSPELALSVSGRAFLDQLSAAKALTVSRDGAPIAAYDLPHVAAAVKSLRECERSVLVERGVDPDSWAALRSGPVPSVNLGKLVFDSTISVEAFRGGGSGTVVVRLAVDTTGKPTDCTVIKKTGGFSLDRRLCRLFLGKARFQPAIGADGTPVAAPFTTDIRLYVSS